MPLAHPNINWVSGTRPQSPADVATGASVQLFILHNATVTPLPMQPASALVPDPAVGYSTSG